MHAAEGLKNNGDKAHLHECFSQHFVVALVFNHYIVHILNEIQVLISIFDHSGQLAWLGVFTDKFVDSEPLVP